MLEALIAEFEAVEDPRDPCRIEHRLIDILVVAVCAVLGAAESFEDMADYGRCKREWLERFLALPNGIPSHDTFRRVLSGLRAHADARRATEVDVAVHTLNRMVELGRPSYVRVA